MWAAGWCGRGRYHDTPAATKRDVWREDSRNFLVTACPRERTIAREKRSPVGCPASAHLEPEREHVDRAGELIIALRDQPVTQSSWTFHIPCGLVRQDGGRPAEIADLCELFQLIGSGTSTDACDLSAFVRPHHDPVVVGTVQLPIKPRARLLFSVGLVFARCPQRIELRPRLIHRHTDADAEDQAGRLDRFSW